MPTPARHGFGPIALQPGRALLLVVVLVMLAGLPACGFQPRGEAVDLERLPQPLKITGIGRYNPLHRELRRQLNAAGLQTALPEGIGVATLHVDDHQSTRRVLAVDSSNRAVEYELEESIRIRLVQDGATRVAPQTIRVVRILYRPVNAILGGNRETTLLREDMRRDLAERALRRIVAQY